ncbi:MAG: TIGR02453 family protein [Pseudomonadota bacterium]
MPSLLTKLIYDAQSFLAALAETNTRDWFAAHKDDYEERLKAPAEQLLSEMRGPLGRMSGRKITTKLFRPQRDLRFSKDKTPYHTHLHMLWSPDFAGPVTPAYFFGIAPDYVTLGAGQPDFDKGAMAAWRVAIDKNGAAMARVMDAISVEGYRISEPGFKRVPAPYGKDHPHAMLLRRKGLSAWRDHDAGLTRDQLCHCFEALTPMVKALAALPAAAPAS